MKYMDKFTTQKRSSIMRAVRSKDTKLERKVRSSLWKRGLRFRKNSSLPGKPDISNKSIKTVVFIDSCFWHGCAIHCRMPKSNILYWDNKISKNKIRDNLITEKYIDKGWNVIRIWEHELKDDFEKCIEKVCKAFSS